MKVDVENDICIAGGIKILSQSEVFRMEDGTLHIKGFRAEATIGRGKVADAIWEAMELIKDRSRRLTFEQWREMLHADIRVISGVPAHAARLTYKQFQKTLMDCFFVFI